MEEGGNPTTSPTNGGRRSRVPASERCRRALTPGAHPSSPAWDPLQHVVGEDLDKAADALADFVYRLANEPATGLWRVQEHAHRTVPQLHTFSQEIRAAASGPGHLEGDIDLAHEFVRTCASLTVIDTLRGQAAAAMALAEELASKKLSSAVSPRRMPSTRLGPAVRSPSAATLVDAPKTPTSGGDWAAQARALLEEPERGGLAVRARVEDFDTGSQAVSGDMPSVIPLSSPTTTSPPQSGPLELRSDSISSSTLALDEGSAAEPLTSEEGREENPIDKEPSSIPTDPSPMETKESIEAEDALPLTPPIESAAIQSPPTEESSEISGSNDPTTVHSEMN